MNAEIGSWGILRKVTWQHVLIILAVIVTARVLVYLLRLLLNRAAESTAPRFRLTVLRFVPIVHLLIGIATVAVIVPIVVEPTFDNVITLVASIGLALAFALKDYASSLAAGVVTILERTYQPGDWIEVDGTYGEVKSIGVRALHLLTVDDTEVIVPHSRLWSTSIHNASSGSRSLLCVADFYLHPDHDAAAVRQQLEEIAESSSYRKPGTAVTAIVLEKPWGTHYRVKGHVKESREQFLFISDVTVRGKEALRRAGVQFAQATYAETAKG